MDERGGVGGGRVGDATGQIRVDRPFSDHGLQTSRVGQGPVARQTAADRLAAHIHVGKPTDVADAAPSLLHVEAVPRAVGGGDERVITRGRIGDDAVQQVGVLREFEDQLGERLVGQARIARQRLGHGDVGAGRTHIQCNARAGLGVEARVLGHADPCHAPVGGGQALDLGQQFHVAPLGRGVRAHAVEDMAPHGIGRLPVAQGVEVVPAEIRVEGEPPVDVRLVQRQRRLELGALGVSERQDVVIGQVLRVERGRLRVEVGDVHASAVLPREPASRRYALGFALSVFHVGHVGSFPRGRMHPEGSLCRSPGRWNQLDYRGFDGVCRTKSALSGAGESS